MGRQRKVSLRHSTGGRFDASNISKDSISQIEKQSRTITDALKLNSSRQREYNRDYESSLGDSFRAEEKNRATIEDLENKKYNTKVSNVKKRQQTEVKYHQDQARIHEKNKEYWKELTPKAAKNFGALAANSWALADDIISEQALAEYDASGGLAAGIENQEKFEASQTNIGTINSLKNSNNPDVAAEVRKTSSLFHTKYSKVIAQRLKDQSKYIEGKIKELNPDLDHTNVQEKYKDFVKGILADAGVSNRTKGYRDSMQLATSLGNAQSVVMKLDYDVIRDDGIVKKKLQEHIANLNSKDLAVKSASYNALVEAIDSQTRPGEYGGLPQRMSDRGGSNLADAQVLAYQLLANSRDWQSKDALDAMSLHLMTLAHGTEWSTDQEVGDPGTKVAFQTNTSWIQRHGKNRGEEFSVVWTKKFNSQKQRATEAVEAEQLAAATALQNRIINKDSKDKQGNSNYLDVAGEKDDFAHRAELIRTLQADSSNPFYQKLGLWKYAVYNPKSETPWMTQMYMEQAVQNGDFVKFNDYYATLPRAQQIEMEGLLGEVESTQEIIGYGKDISASTITQGKAVIDRLNKSRIKGVPIHESSGPAAVAYTHAVWQNYYSDDLKKIQNPTSRYKAALAKVDEQVELGAQGIGIFRRKDVAESGGMVIFEHFVPSLPEDAETVPIMSSDYIRKKASDSGHDWNTFLQNQAALVDEKDDPTKLVNTKAVDGYGAILSEDKIDQAYQALANGRPVAGDANITLISRLYNKPESEVWNAFFNLGNYKKNKKTKNYELDKSLIQTIVRPNQAEEAARKAENIGWTLPPEFNNEEKAIVGQYADYFHATGEMPMKTHIKTWWGGQRINPNYVPSFAELIETNLNIEGSSDDGGASALQTLKENLSINVDPDNGRVQLSHPTLDVDDDGEYLYDPELYQLIQEAKKNIMSSFGTWLSDYWYDYTTNEYVPLNPS